MATNCLPCGPNWPLFGPGRPPPQAALRAFPGCAGAPAPDTTRRRNDASDRTTRAIEQSLKRREEHPIPGPDRTGFAACPQRQKGRGVRPLTIENKDKTLRHGVSPGAPRAYRLWRLRRLLPTIHRSPDDSVVRRQSKAVSAAHGTSDGRPAHRSRTAASAHRRPSGMRMLDSCSVENLQDCVNKVAVARMSQACRAQRAPTPGRDQEQGLFSWSSRTGCVILPRPFRVLLHRFHVGASPPRVPPNTANVRSIQLYVSPSAVLDQPCCKRRDSCR